MTTGHDVIAEAREWLGLPYVHGAALRGVGTDCLGLIAGVGLHLNLPGADRWRADPRVHQYGYTPDARTIAIACREYLDTVIGDLQIGDILLFRFEGGPQHFGFVSSVEPPRIIHAHARMGRVVEHGLDATWKRRIVRSYRFRGLE